jgi:hypothetical protein
MPMNINLPFNLMQLNRVLHYLCLDSRQDLTIKASSCRLVWFVALLDRQPMFDDPSIQSRHLMVVPSKAIPIMLNNSDQLGSLLLVQ